MAGVSSVWERCTDCLTGLYTGLKTESLIGSVISQIRGQTDFLGIDSLWIGGQSSQSDSNF